MTPKNRSWLLTHLSLRQTASPNLGTGGSNQLNGVVAVSANDVWAVGSGTGDKTLIEHWDGVSWSVVASPNPTTYINRLLSVAAVSANDIWAVGYYVPLSGGSRTVIEHWNGTAWSIVYNPNLGVSEILRSVAVVSANDVWAVGGYINNWGDPYNPLIEHWNGTSWSIIPGPNVSVNNPFYGVAVVSANDIWAVGGIILEHWNGTTWSIVPSPNLTGAAYSIASVSNNDVWAVGEPSSLVEHWDGTSWSIASSPNPGPGQNALYGVAAVSSSDIWAVGLYQPNGGTAQTLIARYTDLCFLDLPVQYSNFSVAANGNYGGNNPGRVNSWFDHNPAGQTVTIWTGDPYTGAAQTNVNTCAESTAKTRGQNSSKLTPPQNGQTLI